MLQKSEALALVSRRLEQDSSPDLEFVVTDENIIEKPFGWIFFCDSKKFLETGVDVYRIAVNGPVFVNKMTSEIEFFGSLPSLDVILADYEKKLRERGQTAS
jgi:hypothetical protein